MRALALVVTNTLAQIAGDTRGPSPSAAIANDKGSPIYGVTIPTGYRQWELLAPSREAGSFDE